MLDLTEEKRAYEKVVSLVEELDDLLHIPLKILNIKKLQAKLFIKKVDEALRILELEGTPNLPDELIEKILPLALPVGEFVEGLGLRIARSNLDYVMTTYYCWGGKLTREVPEMVQQLGSIENKLEKFLDETDLYNVWEDLRNKLVLLPCREVVRDLLQASQELKEAINFFHVVVTESAVLWGYLRFLRNFLKTFECVCSYALVEGIRDIVNKALDPPVWYVWYPKEDSLISCFGKLEDVLLGYPTRSKVVKINSIEKMVKELFDGKNGKRLVLLEALAKLHRFTGEIDMICEKFGREDLQSRNASFSILDPITYCLRVFPLSKKNKRARNVCLKKTSKKIAVADINAF